MAEKGQYPPTAPQGGMPDAPPSYEATVSGAAGKIFFLTEILITNLNLTFSPGGFVDPSKVQQKPAPPVQQQPQGQAPGAQPTVIVQYMNPPNFGSNPVSSFVSSWCWIGLTVIDPVFR